MSVLKRVSFQKYKVLVLGHQGMLGNCAVRYFDKLGHDVKTTNFRWNAREFKNVIQQFQGDCILNAIGAIPQKSNQFDFLNFELPFWVAQNTSSLVILPATDGVFSGNIPNDQFYMINDLPDAQDDYGRSKAKIYEKTADMPHVKHIRASVVGIEVNSHASLLSWFLSLPDNSEIGGYENVLWNGITTLEWCKTANLLMQSEKSALTLHSFVSSQGFSITQNILQIASEKITKYQLLCEFASVYNKRVIINRSKNKHDVNRCLYPYNRASLIHQQLTELKEFYGM